MKIPVYIQTIAIHCIGEVDIISPDEFEEAAEKLWESQDYNYGTLCWECSREVELGEWDIANDEVNSYFK